ncbi:Protein of unknown function DUF1064 [uncultured Caudovirales phage]|uniref:DUF1064 domain-containing protein n=1 Tax=uncultured Caudovirales phage TaxID=2100421 RepID=A0A6J5KJI0_9CAUD|nr:Protein of unknown function DUF1064 [uncultured Caudovirales phage]
MLRFNTGGAAKSKFKAVKTEIDGEKFDSKAEAKRWTTLRILQRIGEIADLETQPRFDMVINGQKVCTYVADFRYRVIATGAVVIEDVKSLPTKTPIYRLKKKLLKALHNLEVVEID